MGALCCACAAFDAQANARADTILPQGRPHFAFLIPLPFCFFGFVGCKLLILYLGSKVLFISREYLTPDDAASSGKPGADVWLLSCTEN